MAHATFQDCIAACDACAQTCDHCATAYQQEPDVAILAECIRLDPDCAAICRLASGAMTRANSAVPDICAACALVCDRGVQECERHKELEHGAECSENSRACTEKCRRMSTQTMSCTSSAAP
jgi:hypothetical protein